jgi:large repetitive protein
VHTKTAYVAAAMNPLFAYCPNFARLDWTNGQLSGLLHDAYPEDQGYPYTRERYEASPRARVIERGMPGELFRVGSHSTQFAYTATSSLTGIETTEKKFYKMTITNANGDSYTEIRNLLNQVLEKNTRNGTVAISNKTILDKAGRPIAVRSPNYNNPPPDSQPQDWADRQTFDYAGRIKTSQSGQQALTRFMYDRSGNLRFIQDPQGVKENRINYVKYDRFNRPTENGYIAGIWDETQLQQSADRDLAFPPTPLTWRKKYRYDGRQTEDYTIGRVDQVLVNNGDDGQADVTEQYRYDIFGNTVKHYLVVDAYAVGVANIVDYQYNDVGNVTQITYPETADKQRLKVYYRSDRLNQVTAISEAADFSTVLAKYAYRSDGQPLEQTLDLGGQPIQRRFEFNSPLWLTGIQDSNPAGDLLFSESLGYTQGGVDDVSYYDGRIASARYQSAQSEMQQVQYAYDAIGQIEQVENTHYPDLGQVKPVVYDANGNFQTLTQNGVDWQYQYVKGQQQVQRVINAGDRAILAEYTYDDNGNATRCRMSPHDLGLVYDSGTKMPMQVTDAIDQQKILSFQYGSQNQRVLKTVAQNGQRLTQKLYVRGSNAYPLCELGREADSAVVYIYGPGGLLAMRKQGATYGVIKDHLGSVRLLVDAQAEVVAKYDYLTFGAIALAEEPAPDFMPYLYTGQEYDHEIGLYNYRARFYCAELGRFIGIDPERQFFSPYIYASNNPVLYIDPTGGISTVARVLLGVGLAIVGIGVTIAAVVTGGVLAPAAVAAWGAVGSAVGAAATASAVASAIGSTAAAVAVGAVLGATSGAALGGAFYSLGSSNESFKWSELGQQVGVGAIAGAITGGVATGLSIAGGVFTAAGTATAKAATQSAVTNWIVGAPAAAAAKEAAKAFGTVLLRTTLVEGAAGVVAYAAAAGVTGAVSNIWGMQSLGPGDMALAIVKGSGKGLGIKFAGNVAGVAKIGGSAAIDNLLSRVATAVFSG